MVATTSRPTSKTAGAKWEPTPPPTNLPKFADLLRECLSEPGAIHAAYSAFHDYSLGNQIAALIQCHMRGITPGPLASYGAWIRRRRFVKRGEKAIWLCMPLTVKAKLSDADADAESDQPGMITVFVWKPRWFVLGQTDGDEYTPPPPPDWDGDRACTALGVKRVAFQSTNGNAMGYSTPDRAEVAVSPLAYNPTRTLVHELAHAVLHGRADPNTPDSRALREVEAEAAAYIVGVILGLDSAEYSRGYVQHYLAQTGRRDLAEQSAKRVFSAAQKILAAGREKPASAEAAA